MHAYETRVSHAFRGMEGGADSTKDMNPPEAAEQVEVLCGVNEQVVEGAIAPSQGAPTPPSLSEAQLAAFWAGIVANRAAAKRTAARFVSKDSVEDVVHTAAVLFVEDAQRRSTDPEPFPATPDRFRRKFLKMVRNHALDCVRDSKRPACNIHSHWGIDPEPELRGRNVADRELDTVFARNDHGNYDAPVPTVSRDKDDLNGLHYILRNHMEDLSQTQREILVESFFKEEKRADIAARRGITESTYDNHRQAAFKALRESLAVDVEVSTGIDRSTWYDLVEELIERRAASLRGRSSSKKGKRPNSERKGGNLERKRGNPEDKRVNLEGKRRNPRGERRNVERERRALKGERSNSAHERGNNLREGAADEPRAGTSPGAHNESDPVGRSS